MPGIDVVLVTTPEHELSYRDYVENHTQATTYHLPAWCMIFARGFGYRHHCLLARDRDTSVPLGCLPLYEVRSLTSRRLVAVPFRDRGGPLWSTPGALEALLEKAVKTGQHMGASSIVLKSLHDLPAAITARHGFTEQRHWVRSSVDLRALDEAAFLKAIGPKTRNMIRQSERAGVVFEEADPATQMAAWQRLHLRTQQDLGLPPFSSTFFGAMAEQLAPEGKLKLFLVSRHGQYVAGSLVLLHGKVGIYGYSASLPGERQHRPNDLMLFNIIRWLMQRGYHEFDMGSDSPQQESLLFFKRKWCATQATIPTYLWGGAKAHVADSSDGRYALVRKAFRRLPTPALSLIGRTTTRFFG